jgi:hypothetical protein
MNAYAYQAALLCEDCTDRQALEYLSEYSDNYPQGPYPDGGGEADSPQTCDHCHAFLENSLTSEGYLYLEDMAEKALTHRGGIDDDGALRQWLEFYDVHGPASNAQNGEANHAQFLRLLHRLADDGYRVVKGIGGHTSMNEKIPFPLSDLINEESEPRYTQRFDTSGRKHPRIEVPSEIDFPARFVNGVLYIGYDPYYEVRR